MRRLWAFVLHAIAAGIIAWGWFALLEDPVAKSMMARKGGHFQYLTNQGLFITWSYMTISLLCDMFPSLTVARRLKRTLLMLSLPLEFVVSSIYWSLLLFLPRLILPPLTVPQPATDGALKLAFIPLTTDLALHASPLLTLLIDFFAFETRFSKRHVYEVAPTAILVFSVWYASFVEYCATFNASFPYPFLTHSPFPVRVLIYATAAGIALGCFRMLNALHA